jgi:simple sugar transport system permease protein
VTEVDTILIVLSATLRAGTPLVFAALGELVTERAGVLNLGIEGMMLTGAVVGFIVTSSGGGVMLGFVAAIAAGVVLALIFGFLTLTLRASQVPTGLALTIFGIGLSAFLGLDYRDKVIEGVTPLNIPGLSDLPVVGRLLFAHDPLVYLSIALFVAVSWFLYRSHAGLILRGIGESHDIAHAIGYRVIRIRYLAVAFGGAMSGLAGGYLSLAYTPMWADNMTAGRGWIALALVVFATWRPARVMLGAYLFGGVTILQLHIQGAGLAFSPQLLSTLPYLATIVVLVIISRDATKIRRNAPGALGKAFYPGR